MRKVNGPRTPEVLAKVALLTLTLHGFLALPEYTSTMGLTRPETSLFLDVADVPGSPHPWIYLSWRKVALVAFAVLGYAIGAVAWVRQPKGPRIGRMAVTIVWLTSSLIVVLFNWPELSFGLRDPGRIYPNELDSMIANFVRTLPGETLGRTLVAGLLQTLVVFGVMQAAPHGRTPDHA